MGDTTICGIFGYIGNSKNPEITFALANALLIKTEPRGDHATGFWACEKKQDGGIFFDKEPVKSTVYANRDIWCKDLANADCNLLIGHCRMTTTVMGGSERVNRNNHPHVSLDKTIALIHNGKVTEYSSLKHKFEVFSECDSEILLSMFESSFGKDNEIKSLNEEFPKVREDVACRMLGLKEIFSRVHFGAMAVAIGEWLPEGERRLWLFRNDERPLHVIDLSDTLGQIFFCSTKEIWRSAIDLIDDNKLSKYITGDKYIIEFPADQFWVFQFSNDKIDPKKFGITKTKFSDWSYEGDTSPKTKRIPKQIDVKVISRLDNEENIKDTNFSKFSAANNNVSSPVIRRSVGGAECNNVVDTSSAASVGSREFMSTSTIDKEEKEIKENLRNNLNQLEIDMEKFEACAEEIKVLVDRIQVIVENLVKESSLSTTELDGVMQNFKNAESSLKSALLFLK